MNLFRTYLSSCCLAMTIIAGCDKNDKQAPPPTIPVVATAALTNITMTGATAGGSIVSDGGAAITASGIVWSQTNATPTLEDSVIAGTTSSGTFTHEITGLEDNASYYVRAFATNSVGTGYGEVVTLNTVNDTNKVRFTYNGEDVVYGVIVSPTTGRRWLDRNLGAKQVATAFDDYLAYGDLFQWGRPADGHQLINWTSITEGTAVNGMTDVLATSDTPGHNMFINAKGTDGTTYDWRSDNNSNRWVINPQGPCPAGWHVPTIAEWMAEVSITLQMGGTATSGGITDRNTAYNQLKITASGRRRDFGSIGGFASVGNIGFYWSHTDMEQDGGGYFYTNVRTFACASSYAAENMHGKGAAMPVRCIKD
jgi:uncharacterized protein (TIGR02145 family)